MVGYVWDGYSEGDEVTNSDGAIPIKCDSGYGGSRAVSSWADRGDIADAPSIKSVTCPFENVDKYYLWNSDSTAGCQDVTSSSCTTLSTIEYNEGNRGALDNLVEGDTDECYLQETCKLPALESGCKSLEDPKTGKIGCVGTIWADDANDGDDLTSASAEGSEVSRGLICHPDYYGTPKMYAQGESTGDVPTADAEVTCSALNTVNDLEIPHPATSAWNLALVWRATDKADQQHNCRKKIKCELPAFPDQIRQDSLRCVDKTATLVCMNQNQETETADTDGQRGEHCASAHRLRALADGGPATWQYASCTENTEAIGYTQAAADENGNVGAGQTCAEGCVWAADFKGYSDFAYTNGKLPGDFIDRDDYVDIMCNTHLGSNCPGHGGWECSDRVLYHSTYVPEARFYCGDNNVDRRILDDDVPTGGAQQKNALGFWGAANWEVKDDSTYVCRPLNKLKLDPANPVTATEEEMVAAIMHITGPMIAAAVDGCDQACVEQVMQYLQQPTPISVTKTLDEPAVVAPSGSTNNVACENHAKVDCIGDDKCRYEAAAKGRCRARGESPADADLCSIAAHATDYDMCTSTKEVEHSYGGTMQSVRVGEKCKFVDANGDLIEAPKCKADECYSWGKNGICGEKEFCQWFTTPDVCKYIEPPKVTEVTVTFNNVNCELVGLGEANGHSELKQALQSTTCATVARGMHPEDCHVEIECE